MATIITEPHRTKAGGISPNRLRTFSERSSISLHTFFLFYIYLFHVLSYYYGLLFYVTFISFRAQVDS